MATRVSKYIKASNIHVDKFDIDKVTKDNVVDYILKLTRHDVSRSLFMKLFGSFNGETMIHQYDTFTVPAGAFSFDNGTPDKPKIVSNTKAFDTTFGIWIFNVFFLRDLGFSKLFGGYMNKEINSKAYNNINQTLVYGLLEDKIQVANYKIFINYSQFIMPFESILCPSHTEKILACSKEIDKLKKKLLEENKEEIAKGNPDVAAKIEKQLIDFAVEYLKDDPSIDVFLSGAGGSLGNNFKNMYIMRGAIKDPDPNAAQKFSIATSNFIDGIQADEYALFAKSLTTGPYARAKKTQIGGYWEKLLETAFGPIQLAGVGTDCKTSEYIEVTLTNKNKNEFMYSYIIKSNGKLEELTSDNYDNYIGKTVKVRFAQFCKYIGKGKICNCCAGNFFYRRGNKNMGLAMAILSSKIKVANLKTFHNSVISMAEIDPMKAFGFK